jgi:Acyl-CoA carboxylase epsilon subunit
MTLMDESKTVGIEAFCPLMTSPETSVPTANSATTNSAITNSAAANSAFTDNGAYTADVLRIVRGTPNAEELAALVAALLLTRRAHGAGAPNTPAALEASTASDASHEEHRRPGWLREGYTSPTAWTAGP